MTTLPCRIRIPVTLPSRRVMLFGLVGGIGFEPTTSCMSSMRSNQLS